MLKYSTIYILCTLIFSLCLSQGDAGPTGPNGAKGQQGDPVRIILVCSYMHDKVDDETSLTIYKNDVYHNITIFTMQWRTDYND